MPKKALNFESNDGMSRALVTGLALFGDTRVLDVARTDARALELLDKHRHEWDVVVIDLSSMAEMALVVVLRACEKRLPHQHVLVLAKDHSPPMQSVFATLGVDFVIDKGAKIDELFRTCKSLGRAPGLATGQNQAPRPSA